MAERAGISLPIAAAIEPVRRIEFSTVPTIENNPLDPRSGASRKS